MLGAILLCQVNGAHMNVSDAIAGRFSVRAFKPDPVPRAVVAEILEQAARAPSGGNLQPWRVYGIAGKGRIAVGYDADFTLVDLGAAHRIENRWIASRCGWTPFDGVTVKGWPRMTILRGAVAMREDEVVGAPVGRPVRFTETLG